MQAKKCDRCGTFYEQATHNNRCDYFQIYKNNLSTASTCLMDLCTNCEKDLTKWFNNKDIVEFTNSNTHACKNCIYSEYIDLFNRRLACHRNKPKYVDPTNTCNKWKGR